MSPFETLTGVRYVILLQLLGSMQEIITILGCFLSRNLHRSHGIPPLPPLDTYVYITL